jgi:hypothetical protein
MSPSRFSWVLRHAVAPAHRIDVNLSRLEIRAQLSENYDEYHWPGLPLQDSEAAVGVRFPLLTNRYFFISPLRRSGSQLPTLRLVGSIGEKSGGSVIKYRVRFPIVLCFFLAIAWLIPLCVGMALIISGFGNHPRSGLILIGIACVLAFSALNYVLTIRLPVKEGLLDEPILSESLSRIFTAT